MIPIHNRLITYYRLIQFFKKRAMTLSLLVDLKNITKTYFAGNNRYPVLKGVDFSLQRGEMIAIMGASGSGKSTLMNVIGLLDRCTQGTYYFLGHDVSQLSDQALSGIRNQKIGFVFQSFFLLPRLNVLHNVMLPLFYRDEPEALSQQKAFALLEKMNMEKLAYHKPNQLSGGQQQRVAIARALAGNPDIILADEPTGSLDSTTGQAIMNIFLQLNQEEKRTIVIVTHDKEISRSCQRTVAMKDGKMI
jgi:putative ABC transport system ATP-binding protein